MSDSEIVQLAKAIQMTKEYPFYDYKPSKKQEMFHSSVASQRMLRGANRSGKTKAGAMDIAIHALGEYPKWWKGRKCTKSANILVIGDSSKQLLIGMQDHLVNGAANSGVVKVGGLIHPSRVISTAVWNGAPRGSLTRIEIQSKLGGTSVIDFRSYVESSTARSIMGGLWGHIYCDEEGEHLGSMWPQLLVRLTRGWEGKSGQISVLATPELGYTKLMQTFQESKDPEVELITISAYETDHLTAEDIEGMKRGLSEDEIKKRLEGIPLLGSGQVFPYNPDRYKMSDDTILPDNLASIIGLDVGTVHNTAAVLCRLDRESGTFYITAEYAQNREVVAVHASAIRSISSCAGSTNVPVAWPADADAEKGEGATTLALYKKEGLNLLPQPFTNPTMGSKKPTGRSVMTGIEFMRSLIREGKLIISKQCSQLLAEMAVYQFDPVSGKIKNKGTGDDLIDAARYAIMSAGRYAKTEGELSGAAYGDVVELASKVTESENLW